MKTPPFTIKAITLLTLLLCGSNAVQAQGTAITYQGRLSDGTNPADGSYDFRFALYTADTNGSPTSPTLTNSPVAVNNGLFTVMLDFGAGRFDGTAYWLAIGVRTNGSSADFTTLTPRQALTPHPYALYAPNAGAAAISELLRKPSGGALGLLSVVSLSGLFKPTAGPELTPPLKHDAEKWVPVFRKRSRLDKSIERDDDSKKSHHALAPDAPLRQKSRE